MSPKSICRDCGRFDCNGLCPLPWDMEDEQLARGGVVDVQGFIDANQALRRDLLKAEQKLALAEELARGVEDEEMLGNAFKLRALRAYRLAVPKGGG